MRLGGSIFVFLLGVVLLMPAVHALVDRPSAFKPKAFEPILRIPLREFLVSQQLTPEVSLPSDEQVGASDLRRRYILTAAVSDRLAHCWKELGIDVTASAADRMIPIQPAEGAPYTWSSKCEISGVWFSANGEDHIKLTIRANAPSELPTGELILMPFWQTEAKDRLVGSMIHQSVVRLSWFTTPVAVGLIAAGALLFRRNRRRF